MVLQTFSRSADTVSASRLPLERRIGKNQRVFFFVQVLVAQAVAVLNEGVIDAVGHHVHGADAQHGAVHIVAEEHMVHVVVFFLTVKEDFFFAVLFQVLARCDEKAGSAAGGVADNFVRLGIHQLDHHFDDMARCAELTVQAGLCDFGEQIFIGVTAAHPPPATHSSGGKFHPARPPLWKAAAAWAA